MNDPRMEIAVEVSLGILRQWYFSWELYRDHSWGGMRRLALSAKCRGLIFHDRALRKCADVIAACATTEQERDQLSAEVEALRKAAEEAAIDLCKASDWICREVEAGTKSATHWAIRLNEKAASLRDAMSKEGCSNG